MCVIWRYRDCATIAAELSLFSSDYLSVIFGFYQVLVEAPPTSAVCLDQLPIRII